MSRNVAEPKWGGMASCGRLAIGLLELLLHRKAGRLTIGRRMPSCPTSAHADSPSIRECPVTSGDQSLDAAGLGARATRTLEIVFQENFAPVFGPGSFEISFVMPVLDGGV